MGYSPYEQSYNDRIIKFALMRRQNQVLENNFIIQKQSGKGPLHLLPSFRIANLQNKVTFFEGQLDPLQLQNHQLKQNVVSLSRSISLNTSVLRKLLPVEYDPVKKMKLEMASFEEVTKLIDQNWRMMEAELLVLAEEKQRLLSQISEWKEQFQQQEGTRQREALQYQSQRLQLECKYQSHISSLEQTIAALQAENQALRLEAEEQRSRYDKIVKGYERELSIDRRDFSYKTKEYQACIARLNHNLDSMKFEFEEGKAALKALYEKLSNEKLMEQGETYELMLKFKDEEKYRIDLMMSELRDQQEKEMREKDEIVRMAYEEVQRWRDSINQIQEQLYRKREDMKEISKNLKEVESQLIISKENCGIFEANVLKKQAIILNMEEEHRKTLKSMEQKLKQTNETNKKERDGLSSEISSLVKQIEKQGKQLLAWKERAEMTESSWSIKIQQIKTGYQAKQVQHQKQVERYQKYIDQLKQRIRQIHQQYEQGIDRLKGEQQQKIRKMQRQFKLRKEEYMKEQVVKAGRDNSRNDEELINMKLQFQFQLQNQKKRGLEEIKKVQKEMLEKMSEQEINFHKEKRKLEQKIELLEGERNNANEEIGKLTKKLMQSEDKMEKMKGNHIREITKLEQKNSELVLTWQNLMENQLNQFQKVLMEREMKFGELEENIQLQRQELERKEANNAKDLQLLKKKLEKELKEYKEATGIDHIQKKFKNEMLAMKAAAVAKEKELNASFQVRLRTLVEGHAKDKNNLVSFYTGQLNRTEAVFDDILIGLACQLLSLKVDEEGINEENEREALSTMGRSAKVEYIHERISVIDQSIRKKVEESSKTSEKLVAFEQSIEQQVKSRKEEIEAERQNASEQMQAMLKKALSDLNNSIKAKEQQYSLKANELQKERVRFIEILYEQFKLLSFTHERQYSKLMNKYNELEHHFDHRPSRGQDLAKVKQLLSANAKLTREIELLRKRLQTANDIVKYLNLQLQNYKEMYDIFGPGDMANKTISFNFDPQKNEKYQAMLSKMREHHSKSLAKAKHLEVKVTPFFEEREEGKKAERKTTVDLHHEEVEIKEIRIFGNKEEGGDSVVVLQPKESQRKARKHSFIPAKGKNRYKTEVSPFKETLPGVDSEIYQHSQTFLKLVSGQAKDLQLPSEFQSESKKNMYRRRRLKRFVSGVQAL